MAGLLYIYFLKNKRKSKLQYLLHMVEYYTVERLLYRLFISSNRRAYDNKAVPIKIY